MVATCHWLPTKSENLWPFKQVFSFQIAKSCTGSNPAKMVDGKNFVTDLLAESSSRVTMSWTWALSWSKMQASGQSTLSSTTNSPTSFCQYFRNASLLFPILHTLYEQCPFDQESINIVFTGIPVMCAFSGIGAKEVLHCLLWYFIFGLYWKHHDSSSVIPLLGKVVPSDQLLIVVRTDIELQLSLVIKFV